MISVRSLAKSFHDKKRGVVHALDHISFDVRAREIFGLLGPNGAGKTTCLRLLATILKPTEGTAQVGGADIVQSPEAVRRQIGFLSGDMGSYVRLTAREVLGFFGRLNGLEGQRLRQRIEEMVETFGFGEYADTRIEKLSPGMKQKVAIARTVLHDPPILILDEPSAGLDVPTARLIERFILNSKDSAKCIRVPTQ